MKNIKPYHVQEHVNKTKFKLTSSKLLHLLNIFCYESISTRIISLTKTGSLNYKQNQQQNFQTFNPSSQFQ